jgi:glutamate synthase domain-containing protein 2/nitrite reductase/ring-hydroxylating ferredoxin subunit
MALIPVYARVEDVDLVVVRWQDEDGISVLYGRCMHRGSLLADGSVEGHNLICGTHRWDYRYKTGVSEYHHDERLMKFTAWIDDNAVWVDADEIAAWAVDHPQQWNLDAYQGLYQDPTGTPDEPYIRDIQELAGESVFQSGPHGPSVAMGVPRSTLPRWEDIQFVTAQLATTPLLDHEPVGTDFVIGPNAEQPLRLDIPVFVSDMSFGSLSQEAKTALARGAEKAGTAIASGEGGVLEEEHVESTRYLYELASGRFGFSWDLVETVQAVHFKAGQAAKTGIGGHLPSTKVTPKIAEARDVPLGQPVISPSRFPDWTTPSDFRQVTEEIRDRSGGIPVGFKMSAQRIEDDLDFALEVGVDYVILDGRGGGTGSAPVIFRDNISVPTIPAVARARRHLDAADSAVTLIATGGLRLPEDFVKAMALGADGVAVANSAMQAIGCIGMRACNTDNCPVGITTHRENLRARLPVEEASERLSRFFTATTELMKSLARACGHQHLNEFNPSDLTTFKREMADLAGVPYGGVGEQNAGSGH